MKSENHELTKLKDILNRFVDEELITADILLIANNYLFTRNEFVPFFRHNEMYDTITYLKSIIQHNNLKNADDVQQYYERKRVAFRKQVSERLGISNSSVYEKEGKAEPNCSVTRTCETTTIIAGLAGFLICVGYALLSEPPASREGAWSHCNAPAPLSEAKILS